MISNDIRYSLHEQLANYRRAFPSYKMQAEFYWLFSCMSAFLNHTLSFGKVFDSTYIAAD